MRRISTTSSLLLVCSLLAVLLSVSTIGAATNTNFVSYTVPGGTGDFEDVSIPDSDSVRIITSTGFCLTNDGGSSTWGKNAISPNLFHPYDSFWASDDMGWVCGVLTWYPGPTYESAVYKTTDGGQTWSKLSLPAGLTKRLNAIDGVWASSLGGYSIWAVGQDRVAVHSDDSGSTWTDRSPASGDSYRDVAVVNEYRAIVIDTDGGSAKHYWTGAAWTSASVSLSSGEVMHALDIAPDGYGICVGNNGVIVATDDAGDTWNKTSGVSTGVFGRSEVEIYDDGTDLWAYMVDSDGGVDAFKHESTDWWIKQTDLGYRTPLFGFSSRLAIGDLENMWIVDADSDACVLDNEAPVTSQSGAEDSTAKASITLSATDPIGSGVADTSYALDGGESTEYVGTIDVNRPRRSYTLQWWSVDNAGNTEAKNTTTFDVSAAAMSSEDFIKVEGANRYATAVQASREAFNAASTVVIATGTNWPDALGGAALSGVVEGPLLLTDPNKLPANIAAEITRLKATDAYILGGEGAVSPAVENALNAQLSGPVVRLAGSNRYRTAQVIADKVIALQGSDYNGHAFVATGMDFPDALGASPLAAASGQPILLAPATGSPYLPDDTMSVTVLGGEGAVSADIEDTLIGSLGAGNVDRIGGSNRYSTAALIAQDGVADGLFWDGVSIATGESFPDALSGGAMAGQLGSVMLLTRTNSLSGYAENALGANQEFIGEVHFVGGLGAVSQTVRDKVEQLLK